MELKQKKIMKKLKKQINTDNEMIKVWSCFAPMYYYLLIKNTYTKEGEI